MGPMSFLHRFENASTDRRYRREIHVAQSEAEYEQMLFDDEVNGESMSDSDLYIPSKRIKEESDVDVSNFFVSGMAMVTNLDESQVDSDLNEVISEQGDMMSPVPQHTSSAEKGSSHLLEVRDMTFQNSGEDSEQDSNSRSRRDSAVDSNHCDMSTLVNNKLTPIRFCGVQNNNTRKGKITPVQNNKPQKRPRGRPRKIKTEPVSVHTPEESGFGSNTEEDTFFAGEDKRDLVYAKYVANEVSLIADKDMLALAKFKIAQVLYAAQTGILTADSSLGAWPCLQTHVNAQPSAVDEPPRNYPNIANTYDDPTYPAPAESTSNLDSDLWPLLEVICPFDTELQYFNEQVQ